MKRTIQIREATLVKDNGETIEIKGEGVLKLFDTYAQVTWPLDRVTLDEHPTTK